eukprot:7666615-Ditylum_brightwellii.AAC.1
MTLRLESPDPEPKGAEALPLSWVATTMAVAHMHTTDTTVTIASGITALEGELSSIRPSSVYLSSLGHILLCTYVLEVVP